jgi:hypothetical protein
MSIGVPGQGDNLVPEHARPVPEHGRPDTDAA